MVGGVHLEPSNVAGGAIRHIPGYVRLSNALVGVDHKQVFPLRLVEPWSVV